MPAARPVVSVDSKPDPGEPRKHGADQPSTTATARWARALREHAPDGVDVYFDNVGGETLDAVLGRLARGARVVICGAISQYNADQGPAGPSNYLSLLVNRARMEGFVVFDYAHRYGEAATEIAGWLREGRLRSREDVVAGSVQDFPETFLRLFRGENVGKLVLQTGPE